MSLTLNIIRTYRGPGAVVGGMASQGVREPQVLVFNLMACGLIFVAQWPVFSREAALDPSLSFEERMAGALFGVMFMLPLLFYGLAGLVQLGLRVVRRPAPGILVRLAVFWAFLSIAPLMLVHGGLRALVGATPAVGAFGFVVALAFLYILAAGLREIVRQTRRIEA